MELKRKRKDWRKKQMRGMPFNFQGKVQEIGAFASSVSSSSSPSEAKCKKEGSFASNEPISVLDTRSPSPSTSTSTLSSFGGASGGGGGGSGSTDNTAGLAAVSDNATQQKWLGSLQTETSTVMAVTETTAASGGGLKEEWALELQPIPAGSDMGVRSSERLALGLEDWESLLSESAASPGQDQSLLRWIAGDLEETPFSLKQLLQGGNTNEIDGNVALNFINQSSGLETTTPGVSANGNFLSSLNSSSFSVSGSGFSLENNNNGKNGSVSVLNSSSLNNNYNPQNPSFTSSPNCLVALPPGVNYLDQKSLIFNPQVMMNQPHVQSTANQNMLSPLSYSSGAQQEQLLQFQPQVKRHNPGFLNSICQIPKVQFLDPGHEFLIRKQQPQMGVQQQLNLPPHHLQQKPSMVPKQEGVAGSSGCSQQIAASHQNQQQPVIYDQLCKAAELLLAGNFSLAQGILARLNHQLSPVTRPFQRCAFYFKEALQLPLLLPNPATTLPLRIPTPLDGMFKMGAYKLLSEVSPLIQFMNFTSNQTLLEALDDAENIHIIDFDIGFGAQWASFMQELPRRNGGSPPSLKITAFASPSTHHPIEIGLMHENLTQFANEIGVSFELEVVNFDSFDPTTSSFRSSENEAIAVNFPIWSISSHLSALPSILRFIKQLSPKVMVTFDRGCERTELPFSHHLLHALQYYEVLLDSIDAANMSLDTTNKIERFIFQPRIESIVLGRILYTGQMPPWKNLFAASGFSPVTFSNFAETQAECVVKRSQVRGFHVEKRQAFLVLCWQHKELMSASAWRC